MRIQQEKKKVAQDTVRSEEPVVHAGCWNVETPEAVPNLELPIMNYHAQWFGEVCGSECSLLRRRRWQANPNPTTLDPKPVIKP